MNITLERRKGFKKLFENLGIVQTGGKREISVKVSKPLQVFLHKLSQNYSEIKIDILTFSHFAQKFTELWKVDPSQGLDNISIFKHY